MQAAAAGGYRGLTGTTRARPGLDQALAAVRVGDTLVVLKLDRLARSVPDAREIGDTLAARGVRLSLGGAIYDPADPMSKMFFNMLAVFAEFEVRSSGSCAQACDGLCGYPGWRCDAGRRARAASRRAHPANYQRNYGARSLRD